MGRDLSHIGNCLCDLGRLDEAVTAFKEAHGIDTAVLGPEHIHTATDAASLGVVFATQRRWKEAVVQLDGAHRVLERSLDPNHPNLAAVTRFLEESRASIEASGEM